MESINIAEKYGKFTAHWTPKIIAESNGQLVKLAKLKGDFIWHNHEAEDELFMIMKGVLTIEFRDKSITLKEGEMIVVPKGVDHRPKAEEEAWVLLVEPVSTYHTGNVKSERTVENQEWI